jgi:hypothetical protein
MFLLYLGPTIPVVHNHTTEPVFSLFFPENREKKPVPVGTGTGKQGKTPVP